MLIIRARFEERNCTAVLCQNMNADVGMEHGRLDKTFVQ
jgi:hypothetical protein